MKQGGAYKRETDIKSFDWSIEKVIASSSESKNPEKGLIRFEINSVSAENGVENLRFGIRQSEFGNLFESMTALRNKTMQILN